MTAPTASAAAPSSAFARHAASAKRLLVALRQQADASANLLGSDAGAEFLAALDERERMLGELNGLFQAISRERVAGADRQARIALLEELAASATAALDAHERLTASARQERDRLGAAVERSNRPDTVAHRYAAYAGQRSAGLSITG